MPDRVTKRNHPRRTETHFFQLFNLNFAFLTIFCSQLLSYYQLILAYKIVKVIWRQFTALSPDCTKTHTLESVTILCNNISIILCTSSTVWDNRLFHSSPLSSLIWFISLSSSVLTFSSLSFLLLSCISSSLLFLLFLLSLPTSHLSFLSWHTEPRRCAQSFFTDNVIPKFVNTPHSSNSDTISCSLPGFMVIVWWP